MEISDRFTELLILDTVALDISVETKALHAYDSALRESSTLLLSRVSAEGFPRRQIFVNPELSGPIFRRLFHALNADDAGETLVPLFLFDSAEDGASRRERRLLSMRLDKAFPVEGDFRSDYPVLFGLMLAAFFASGIPLDEVKSAFEVYAADYMDDFSTARSICRAMGLPNPSIMLRLSSLPYENERAQGAIAFCRKGGYDPIVGVNFVDRCTLSLDNLRELRKYLQMSSTEAPLIAICGQGKTDSVEMEKQWEICAIGQTLTCDALVTFKGFLRWELNWKHSEYVSYNGIQFVFRSAARIKDEAAALVSASGVFSGTQERRIIDVIHVLQRQKKGTMVVFSEVASSEAERLGACGRGIRIAPIDLHKHAEMLLQLSAIDGALLADMAGTCYAIGVLCDGEAVPDSMRGRGARYNSAAAYAAKLRKEGFRCFVAVISEDGMLDAFY